MLKSLGLISNKSLPGLVWVNESLFSEVTYSYSKSEESFSLSITTIETPSEMSAQSKTSLDFG